MCGIFYAAVKNPELLITGKDLQKIIYGLKHRGSENWGVTSRTNGEIFVKKSNGKPGNFEDKCLGNEVGISTRYSTQGVNKESNYTPAVISSKENVVDLEAVLNAEETVICLYNGEANTGYIKKKLEKKGYEFKSSNDTAHLTAYVNYQIRKGLSFLKAVNKTLTKVSGAFSIIFMHGNQTIAARGKEGTKPLEMMINDNYTLFSSETQLFGNFDKRYHSNRMSKKYNERGEKIYNYENGCRQVYAGEIILVENGRIIDCDTVGSGTEETSNVVRKTKLKKCLFEWYYFSKPGNTCFGADTQTWRGRNAKTLPRPYGRLKSWILKLMGKIYVVPVPMSGNSGAAGFADYRGYKLREGIVISDYYKSTFNERTFIQPTDELRDSRSEDKYEFIPSVFSPKNYKSKKGFLGKVSNFFNHLSSLVPKTHILVDDSIVNGRTTVKVISEAFLNGAEIVKSYSTSPPIINGCFWGVDIKEEERLIAHGRTVEEINEEIIIRVREIIEKEAPDLISLITKKNIKVVYNKLEDSIRTADSFLNKKGEYCTHCFDGSRMDEVGVQKDAYEKNYLITEGIIG